MATKLNLVVTSAIVLACVVTPVFLYRQAQGRVREQGEALSRQSEERALLQAEKERLSDLLASAQSPPPVSDAPPDELLRLRGEVARLRAGMEEAREPRNQPLSREDTLASLRQLYQDRINRLKQLAGNAGEAVPELKYFTDEDWLQAVQFDGTSLANQDDRHTLSSLRSGAQIKFALRTLADALKRYGKANQGAFPEDVSQLAAYLGAPVDASVLQDWAILPTSRLPSSLRIDEDWVLTQRAAVNPELDQRVVVGMKETRLGTGGSNDWAPGP
jgi:hypothetical protein